MATSPNTDNYLVGKGECYFTPEGGTVSDRYHMGNATVFEVELTLEELEHFSSMTGVKTKDLTVVTSKSAVVRVTLEEWTQKNLAMALLGDVGEDTDGNVQIDILSQSAVKGKLEFIASNDVGPKWDYEFPSVSFRPNSAISPISDEWGTLELEGEVLAVSGTFGTATLQDSATTESATP